MESRCGLVKTALSLSLFNGYQMESIRTFTSGMTAVFEKIAEKVGLRLFIGLSLSVGTLVLFGWLADQVFEGDVAVFDSTIREGFQQIAGPVLTGVMIFFTYLGSVYGIVGLFAASLLILFFLNQKRATALLSITMGGEALLGIVLKLSFQRQRPEAFFGFTPPDTYSFPSGHAFASLCFFGALALIATSQIKSRVRIAAVWLAAAFFILAIGTSRIYLGVHYPSAIVAGYLAGIVWLSAVYSADHRMRNRAK